MPDDHHPVMDWLLACDEPWTRYRARLDLLGETAEDARQEMLSQPGVQQLVAGLQNWPGEVLASHKSASQPFHRLNFLADLGLRASDPGMPALVEQVLSHPSEQGPLQLVTNVPQHFGGSGQDTRAWALCDAPLLLYALANFGLGEHPQVQKGVAYLAGLVRDNGWPCAVSPSLGTFRGPGRKQDPCPFATLAMLKLLAVLPEWQDSPPAHLGAEALLGLWQRRESEHPYIFYMGNDFCKLKAPLVWYDLLHVLDVLSRFAWLRQDARLRQMLEATTQKADAKGRYTAESVWTAWKGWSFADKKNPSPWLTLLVLRIQKRMAA
jgi:hypothetical protein